MAISFPQGIPALCSFSGGKDSCLALWHAQQQGLDVSTLLVMFDEDGQRSRSHAIPPALIRRQAEALGLQLMMRNASWQTYEAVFSAALRELRATGHRVAVFGDLDLQAHRDWEEKVCAAADVEPCLPLWHQDHASLAAEVTAQFGAVVVCTDSRHLGDEYCGRIYDADFIRDLPPDVDVCGENGEFHTFVYDGPNFRTAVPYTITGFEDYVTPEAFGSIRYHFARLAP